MRFITPLLALALVFLLTSAIPSPATNAAAGPFVDGEVLVKFNSGLPASTRANIHSQVGGTVLAEIARTGVQLVKVPPGQEDATIRRYSQNPNVLYSEPNYIRSVPEPISHPDGSQVMPQDHYFDEQWALHNTGQLFQCIPWIFGELCLYIGTADADIDAPEAWAISTGSSSVKVAVIDTGIDYTHPDLAGRYVGGHDYIFNDNDPMDDHGHGTHVSGTIAALMNNLTGSPTAAEEGVVGVAPNSRILAYKVCAADGSCSDFAIQQAIAQAIVDGAKVISMSLGGAEYSRGLDDAVQDAWSAGLVIIAGAGNDGNQNLFYPAALNNVVSVGAFDEDHRRASFSNYGNWVDISAPGNVIMSTYLTSACGGVVGGPGDEGCYNWLSGTSMATPHVSGAAALVWSRADVSSNAQVVDILLQSADGDGVDAVRLDSWTIHGGLNIHDALAFGAPPPTGNVSPIANAGVDQTANDDDGDGFELFALDGSGSSDSDGSIVTYVWTDGPTTVGNGPNPSFSFAPGIHTVTLTVTDNQGATDDDTVVVTVIANQPPIANAGPDQIVQDTNGNGSESVTLVGTGSDADGTIASYAWSEGATPLGSVASPTVNLALGIHTITLTVTDNGGASASDTVAINVTNNAQPVAQAGPDQTLTDTDANGSQPVTLDGSASSDSDGSIASYVWKEGTITLGSGVSLTTPLAVGSHTIVLTVTDNGGLTATDSVLVTVNPAPACVAGNTGWLSPTGQVATTGGDGNGFEIDPTLALTDGLGEAANMDGADDRHIFQNFGASIPGNCRIIGIEVRLDWRLDSTAGSNRMRVDLSWNGGTSWSTSKSDHTQTVVEHTTILGSTTNTWGRTWNVANFADSNFRIRLTSMSSQPARDFFLDWVVLRVTFGP